VESCNGVDPNAQSTVGRAVVDWSTDPNRAPTPTVSTCGAVLLSFDAAVPIRHLAVVAFRPEDSWMETSAWTDSCGSLARVEYSMDGEAFTLCGRLPEDFSAYTHFPLPDTNDPIAVANWRAIVPRCRRIHEIAIERNIVARHLRFVSHEGPIGLSQVFLNRDYNGYEERADVLPAAPPHVGPDA